MEKITYKPSRYSHKLDDGRIQCDLCPHACRLREGQHGFCFVRMRQHDQIVLTAYGKCSGLGIDPIEKKPLYHFLPGSTVLSFGTIGCNLGCSFCQNWRISFAKRMELLTEDTPPETIAKMAKDHRSKSVAFTYNEPIIFFEYMIDTAKACHALGIKTVAVSNGYICAEPRKELFNHIDAANIDLKSFTESFYRKITLSHLQPVLDTLVYIKHSTNTWLEITTLLIPGLNDSEQEIDKMTKWIFSELGADIPLHFSAFYPAHRLQNVPATPLETLQKARAIALKNGLFYVYTGNVYDPEGSITYCHNCKYKLIERNGFDLTACRLQHDGLCPSCKTKCAGVF